MKRPVKAACGLLVSAVDGAVGGLADVYVHETRWLIRDLVVSCYGPARRVLIPITFIPRCRFHASGIRLGVARDELTLLPRSADALVRSARSVAGYGVEATDGAAGRVADLVVDDAGWWIPSLLLVDTRGLFPGSEHEVPTSAVAAVDPLNRRVHLRITRAQTAKLPAPRQAQFC